MLSFHHYTIDSYVFAVMISEIISSPRSLAVQFHKIHILINFVLT